MSAASRDAGCPGGALGATLRLLGMGTAMVLGGTLLGACGSGKGAPAAGGAAQASTPTSGCNSGAAGTASYTLAVAQEPASGVAQPTAKCWAAIKYTAMTQPSVRQAPSGDTGQFKVAWNAQNLYVLADIHEWPLHDANSSAMHKDDAVEFYLAGDNAKGASYDPNDCQVTVTYAGEVSKNDTCPTSQAYTPVVKTIPNKGYFDELVVPWSTLNVGKAAKGQKYAFTIAFDIGDSSGNRVAQVEWAGGANDDWEQTANWGTITLQ